MRYAGAFDVAQNFTVNGERTHAEPPFSFADEFRSLALLSDTWGQRAESDGATVTLQPWGELQLDRKLERPQRVHDRCRRRRRRAGRGRDRDAAVRVCERADQRHHEHGDHGQRPVPQRLPRRDRRPADLEPPEGDERRRHAGNRVEGARSSPLTRRSAAPTIRSSPDSWSPRRSPAASGRSPAPRSRHCPAAPVEPPPDTSLGLEALCVDPFGNLAMRLRNTGDRDRDVDWDDLAGPTSAPSSRKGSATSTSTSVGGGADSRIRVRADGGTTVTADGTGERCEGDITVTKRTSGPAPPGPWTIVIAGADGQAVRSAPLAAGQSVTFDALGGYEPGTAQFGEVVGGIVYTIREPDTLGGTATISHNPVEILTGQHESVTVTTTSRRSSRRPGKSRPAGAAADRSRAADAAARRARPAIGAGPGRRPARLCGRRPRATAPRRAAAGAGGGSPPSAPGCGISATPGGRGGAARAAAAAPADERRVAEIVSLSVSQGECRHRRPIRCTLGRVRPGAQVVVRTRARVNFAGNAPERRPRVVAQSRVQHHQQHRRRPLAVHRAGQPARADHGAAHRPRRRAVRVPRRRDGDGPARRRAGAAVRAPAERRHQCARGRHVRIQRRALPQHPTAAGRQDRLVHGHRRAGPHRAVLPHGASHRGRTGRHGPRPRAHAGARRSLSSPRRRAAC